MTDHSAIVARQRRWYSNRGGFSASLWLNECYRAAYAEGWDTQFFSIKGLYNPADRPSRDSLASVSLDVAPSDVVLPLLAYMQHEHTVDLRQWYMV